MDIEEKQADLIDCFVKQAQSLTGASLAGVVVDATSHPSLFAFSEILSVPNVAEVVKIPFLFDLYNVVRTKGRAAFMHVFFVFGFPVPVFLCFPHFPAFEF